ncbi:Glutamate--tRNA ligase 1 [Anatilimnocola aggregata]|uniref:Glutamyl-Q tRNA(Asp) synthetase n=1 Tax=Anatilimnocola aggregata TaxID=2528021 RepID=A0A517Y553_9BACT|nr:tRNA glutamyl-Q(34) synthetase GluQRS [Anatilimnocola aggregata]QDU25252.1 Glutamate--tRNA ligase 1 [Anatilimnocola aggregata]
MPAFPSTSPPIVGRLAPSPTGAQHVGNARTFLLAWLSARSQQGKLILRMEDIDSPRIKPGAAQQAIDDLRWLGLEWDEGPDVGGPQFSYVQTERLPLYEQALAQLKQAERIYPCTCTRSEVAAAASAPHAGQEGPRYPGTCAANTAALASRFVPGSFAWRFRTTDERLTIHDGLAGEVSCSVNQELGDFVIAKADGTPAYQLAVVVDDHAMGITEVVRGDDLLPSAFRQQQLYDFFGWQPPRFIHVPLVIGEDGRRLAKRHGDTRLATFRAAGIAPERIIGLLAWSCGLRPTAAPIHARELLADFSWQRIAKIPFVFTEQMHFT